MKEVIRALRVMQRMERLATALYRVQLRAFREKVMTDRLKAAEENEREHAETLGERLRAMGSSPAVVAGLFGMAGTVIGFITTLCGKRILLKTDVWIEEHAIKDYLAFLRKVKFDEETVVLINRIVDDERRHVETWQSSIEMLQD